MALTNASRISGLVVCGLIAGCLVSCAEQSQSPVAADPGVEPGITQSCKIPEVKELWQERKADSSGDFAIGPGDQITISVPEVEESGKTGGTCLSRRYDRTIADWNYEGLGNERAGAEGCLWFSVLAIS